MTNAPGARSLELNRGQRGILSTGLDGSKWHLGVGLVVEGDFIVDAFKDAISIIVGRHPILRSNLVLNAQGSPILVTRTTGSITLDQHHLQGEGVSPSVQLHRMMKDWAFASPISYSELPDVRCRIQSYHQKFYLVGFCFHHLVFDGHSKHVLANDISRCYNALVSNNQQEVERLQREVDPPLLQDLKSLPYPPRAAQKMSFPTRPSTPQLGSRGRCITFRWGKTVIRALREISTTFRASEFEAIMTTIAICLRGYANRTSEIHFAVNTRSQSDLRSIGMFVEDNFACADISVKSTFQEVLETLRRQRYCQLGLDDTFDRSGVQLMDSHQGLGKLQLSYLRVPSEDNLLHGLKTSWKFNMPTFGEDGVTLYLLRRTGSVEGRLEYDPRVLDALDANQLILDIKRLFDSFREPKQRVGRALGDVGILRPRRELLSTKTSRIAVLDLVKEAVQLSPFTVACEDRTISLTYHELYVQSERLASLLLKEIGSGDVVGLCMPDGPLATVATLAIWMAGGVYLPLDPAWPINRTLDITRRVDCPLLLTIDEIARTLEESSGNIRILATSLATSLPVSQASKLPSNPSEGPAYIMFTSGSTGIPKQVTITHSSLGALARAMKSVLSLDIDERILKFAPLTYDASIWELLCGLLSRGTLCYYPRHQARVGRDLANFIKDEAISVATLTPSALSTIPSVKLPGLRLLVSAGEPCSQNILRGWGRDRRFINAYGPTETTVCATTFEWDGKAFPNPVPVGTELPHVRVDISDHEDCLVRPGIIAEICISGDALAEEVCESGPTRKAYRTGDSGWKDMNDFVYVTGRFDDQIKVGGHRVHPSEVERILQLAPGVRRATVVPMGSESRRYLGAAVSLDSNVDLADLRAYANDNMPVAMRPVVLKAFAYLPQTLSGKVDRETVLKWLERRHSGATNPSSGEMVEEAWKIALGLEKISVQTHFFGAGGTSLTAAFVMGEVNEYLGCALPLSLIFDNPTLGAFLEAMSEQRAGEGYRLPEFPSSTRSLAWPASAQQELIYRVEEGFFGQSRKASSFKLSRAWLLGDGVSVQDLSESLKFLILRHNLLMTAYSWRDGRLWAQTLPRQEIPLSIVHWRGSGDALGHTLREHWRIVNSHSTPFRVTLLELASEKNVLVMSFHHIVADDESINIIAGELSNLYGSGSRQSAKSTGFISYSEYAQKQRSLLTLKPESPSSELTVLSDATPGTQLPIDFQRPRNFLGRISRVRLTIEPALLRNLLFASGRLAVTQFQFFVAVASKVLMQLANQNEVVFISTYHSRDHRTRVTVGPFARLVSIRVGPIDYSPNCKRWLELAKGSVLGAFDRPLAAPSDLGLPKDFDDLMVVLLTMKLPEADLTLRGKAARSLQIVRSSQRQALEIALISDEIIFHYRTDVFREKRILSLASDFERAMREFLTCESINAFSRSDHRCRHQSLGGRPQHRADRVTFRGVKVNPREIESYALAVPGIHEVHIENESEWTRNPLKMRVVFSGRPKAVVEKELLSRLTRMLPPYAIPEILCFQGEELGEEHAQIH